MTVTFFVPGVPIPKGSAKGFVIPGKGGKRPRAIVTHDNKKTKPWQHDIRLFAAQAWKAAPTAGPVGVLLNFCFVRPGSVSEKKRPMPIVKPDLDKLVRTVYDGLRGVVYLDDSQVCDEAAKKRYGDRPGVSVTVWAMDDQPG